MGLVEGSWRLMEEVCQYERSLVLVNALVVSCCYCRRRRRLRRREGWRDVSIMDVVDREGYLKTRGKLHISGGVESLVAIAGVEQVLIRQVRSSQPSVLMAC
jgi:hypothetical protein